MLKIRALTCNANHHTQSSELTGFFAHPAPLKLLYCDSKISDRLLMLCVSYLHITGGDAVKTYLIDNAKPISMVIGMVEAAISGKAALVAFQMRADTNIVPLLTKLLQAGINVMIAVPPPLDPAHEASLSHLFRQLDQAEGFSIVNFDYYLCNSIVNAVSGSSRINSCV